MIFSEAVVLCPEIQNTVEKNWSFWNVGTNLYFSYGLYPKHEIYGLEMNEDKKLSCSGIKIVEQNESILQKLSKYYSDKLAISVTTPAIRFNEYEFLGVGHVKYRYLDEIDKFFYTPLYDFTMSIRSSNKIFHDYYIYLMYFYTFDAYGNVTGISDMFIPQSDGALCFPSGLTYSNTLDIIVSYGDLDNSCNLLFFNNGDVKKMIKRDNKPENILFKMLD